MNSATKKPMKKRMTIMLLLVGIVFAAIIGYQMFVASMMKQFLSSNAQPPATVTAMQVKHEMWQPQISAVGTLRAIQGVDISAEISGMVKDVYFKSGDRVKAGQLLLELNSAEEVAQLDALRASRKQAEASFKRDQKQYKVKAISRAKLEASEADFSSKKAQEAAQRAIIDKKQIRAPFAGKLGVSKINPGQFLNVAEHIVPLQNIDSLYVDFHVPQKFLNLLKEEQSINVADSNGNTIRGRITTINTVVDVSTRNVAVEAMIENSDGLLLPGMFVQVKINTGEPKAQLTLPQTSVSYNAYGSTLFLAKPGVKAEGDDKPAMPVAQQVFVKTGDKRGDQVAILEGLNEGDMVVTSGLLKLKNGTPLIINNEIQPANEMAPVPQEQ